MLLPLLIYSQISREFESKKINGDFIQVIEKDYENVKLDKNGKPILPKNAIEEYLHFYENGYSVETQAFEYNEHSKELSWRVLIKRNGSAINNAKLYSYNRGKERLLREHSAIVEDGKLRTEKIIKNGKEVATVQYTYGNINGAINFEVINLSSSYRTVDFYTEFDKYGTVFSAQINEIDTIMSLRRIEVHGDSIRKSILINKKINSNSLDSILFIERTWFDSNNNPTMDLKQMIALTEPPAGEPKTANFVSTYSYLNSENKIKTASSPPTNEELYGAWRNESNNIEIFFEPKRSSGEQRFYGSSYLLKSTEPSIEEYLANGKIWIFMLKQEFKSGSWIINEQDELKVILKNGSILTFSIILDNNILILKPKMKDMKGELRFSKSG